MRWRMRLQMVTVTLIVRSQLPESNDVWDGYPPLPRTSSTERGVDHPDPPLSQMAGEETQNRTSVMLSTTLLIQSNCDRSGRTLGGSPQETNRTNKTNATRVFRVMNEFTGTSRTDPELRALGKYNAQNEQYDRLNVLCSTSGTSSWF
jgi:hypothetical protein